MFTSRWRRWFQYPIVFCLPASPCLTLPSLPSQIAGHVIASQSGCLYKQGRGWWVVQSSSESPRCWQRVGLSLDIFSSDIIITTLQGGEQLHQSSFNAHSAPARRYYDYLEIYQHSTTPTHIRDIQLFCRSQHIKKTIWHFLIKFFNLVVKMCFWGQMAIFSYGTKLIFYIKL